MKQIIQRLKEPSSWAGIAVLINVFGGLVGLPAGASDVIVQAGSGVAAALAFFMAEKRGDAAQ